MFFSHMAVKSGPSTPPKSQSTAQTETPEKAVLPVPAEAKEEMKVAETKVPGLEH